MPWPFAIARSGLATGVAFSATGASTTLNATEACDAVYFSNFSTFPATVALGYGAAPSVAYGAGPTIPPNGQMLLEARGGPGGVPTHFFAIGPAGSSGTINACPARVARRG